MCPEVSATLWTFPGTSFRSVIDRSARTVPIEDVVRRYWRSVATAAVTDSIGSGWLAEATSACRRDARFEAARPAAIAPIVTNSRADPKKVRLFISPSSAGEVLPAVARTDRDEERAVAAVELPF